MENLQTYYNMIENCIRDLGVDPALCRGEQAGNWNLRRGSAFIRVDIAHIERENAAYFQVLAPVMQLPSANLQAFYQELLELNFQFYGVAFVKLNDWIFVKVIREVEGLEQKEAAAMINRVGWYADEYDDKLKARYGTQPGAHG